MMFKILVMSVPVPLDSINNLFFVVHKEILVGNRRANENRNTLEVVWFNFKFVGAVSHCLLNEVTNFFPSFLFGNFRFNAKELSAVSFKDNINPALSALAPYFPFALEVFAKPFNARVNELCFFVFHVQNPLASAISSSIDFLGLFSRGAVLAPKSLLSQSKAVRYSELYFLFCL